MRRPLATAIILCGLLGLDASAEHPQVRVESEGKIRRSFSGRPQALEVRLHNSAGTNVVLEARIRLLQTTSATAVQVADLPWKKLEVLPGQTVLELATVDFPAVKAGTRFLIQWLEGTNRIFGTTAVLVYPTNLLAELKPLAGDVPVGVFDPGAQLKPLLRAVAVEFQDLLEDGTDKFAGRLAIFGPFASRKAMCAGLAADIHALAKRGAAVVWLQPPRERREPLKPSFYTVRTGEGTVIVAQHELTADLAQRPQAQLNLLQLAQAALRPPPLELPDQEKPN